MSTAKKLGAAAALLMVSHFLSRILGFVREMVIAALFGATGKTDAFIAAFTLPDWLNYVLAGGTLSITFIPIYSRHLAAGDEEEGNRIYSVIATVMGALLVAGIIVLEILAPSIVQAYLHRLAPEHRELAVSLTRILLPAQFFFYLGGLSTATLFSRQLFWAASLSPLVYNLGTILGGLLLGRMLGVASLAWGTLAGAVVGPFLIPWIAAHRAGLRYRPNLNVKHPDFTKWLLATLPLMFGVMLVTADEWIIRYFAAAETGAISCINYARKLVMAPNAIIGQAVGVASMPFFARLYAEGKQQELSQLLTKSARGAGALAALCGAAMVATALPLVDVLFHRGQFSAAAVAPTARYLSLMAVALPLWAIQNIVARAFYATGDTWTPAVAGTAVTALSFPMYWALYQMWGPDGLLVASGIGIFLHTAVLFALLPRKIPFAGGQRAWLWPLLRAGFVGAIAAVAAWAAAHYLPTGNLQGHLRDLVQLSAAGAVFIAVAWPLLRPFRIEEGIALTERMVRRFRRAG